MIVSLIFVKISDKNKEYFKKYVFNTTFNFTSFNNFYEKYFGSIFHKDDTKMVFSENIDYLVYDKYLDGIKVSAVNQNVVSLKGGIVIFKGNKDGYNNTVIIQQSNGYYAWYGNIKEEVKLYDYIEAGETIGTSSDEYYYALLAYFLVLMDELLYFFQLSLQEMFLDFQLLFCQNNALHI